MEYLFMKDVFIVILLKYPNRKLSSSPWKSNWKNAINFRKEPFCEMNFPLAEKKRREKKDTLVNLMRKYVPHGIDSMRRVTWQQAGKTFIALIMDKTFIALKLILQHVELIIIIRHTNGNLSLENRLICNQNQQMF